MVTLIFRETFLKIGPHRRYVSTSGILLFLGGLIVRWCSIARDDVYDTL